MVIKDLLTRFFDAYLVKRDLETALSLLSDDVFSLGTGAHEVALNKAELRELMKKEFRSIPGGFGYEIKDYTEHSYRADLYAVYCTVRTSMPDEEGGELSFWTRLTAIALERQGEWRLINLHMSAPSDQQEEEEFFPIKYSPQAVGKLKSAAGKKLVEIMLSMLPGGIMGGYLEDGFPLYIVNDTMLSYLGYTYDELVQETGEQLQRLIEPEDWQRVKKEMLEGIKETGEYDVQYRVIRKDGVRLWVNGKGHEITTEDGRKAMISVLLDISEDVRLQEKLRKEAMEDPLTGILNRKGAISHFDEYVSKGRPGTMFLLDIDNFKQINDTYGHQTGDQVLVMLAKILRDYSREKDIVARIGGDEFMLFLPNCTQEGVVVERAANICSAFSAVGAEYGEKVFTVSIGIAFTDGNTNFDRLFKIADDRLYSVKKNGKNGFLHKDLDKRERMGR